MNEVFEKMIEQFGIMAEKSEKKEMDAKYFEDAQMYKGERIAFGDAIEIVKQEAEQYKRDNYFNLDNVTLHKCPKCGSDAQHRVNKRGSWACGCFKCNLFKFDFNHDQAIQSWEDFCREQYNNGWIPCSRGVMPRANGWYLVTNHLGVVQEQRRSANHWEKLRDDAVLAWRELPLPYQPKGEMNG